MNLESARLQKILKCKIISQFVIYNLNLLLLHAGQINFP
jgi:hypothetical protein